MKIVLLSLFVAAVTAASLDKVGPVELIVTVVADSEPLEIENVLDNKVKENINGEQVYSTNLLHFSAQDLAESAAVIAADADPTDKYLAEPDDVTPYNVEVITLPEIEPESIIGAPEPVLPKVVAVVEAPAVVEVLPEPAAQLLNGEVFNDENVQVSVNTPEDAGILATMQSWFNMVLNYFNNGAAVSQQIA